MVYRWFRAKPANAAVANSTPSVDGTTVGFAVIVFVPIAVQGGSSMQRPGYWSGSVMVSTRVKCKLLHKLIWLLIPTEYSEIANFKWTLRDWLTCHRDPNYLWPRIELRKTSLQLLSRRLLHQSGIKSIGQRCQIASQHAMAEQGCQGSTTGLRSCSGHRLANNHGLEDIATNFHETIWQSQFTLVNILLQLIACPPTL